MASMFYEGDLQSGIHLALRESKSVACFVRDDGEESSKWENEYLDDAQVRAALTDKAITLRLQSGSQEAKFLAAYYPVQAVPALIIIHNGSLILDLKSGQDKAAFKAGVLTTLIAASSRTSIPATAPSTETPSTSTPGNPTSLPLSHEQITEGCEDQASTQASVSPERQPVSALAHVQRSIATHEAATQDAPSSSTVSSGNHQPVIQRLLEERRRKLEVDKKEKEEAEKADRKAKAEARKDLISAAPDSAKAKQATYAEQQRKRNAEAKLDRERILRQIEQDKIDRREREQRRQALSKAEAQGDITEYSNVPKQHDDRGSISIDKHPSKPDIPMSKDCAVQVRLFDGSTIRSRFSTERTLTDIREWVDRERSDDLPYTFKQILSPSPNRSLTISEEKESLAQLRFVPSVTLVMVPIKGYTGAYTDASGPGIISKVASIPYNTVAAGAGLVAGALSTFLGLGQATPQRGESPSPTSKSSQSESRFNNAEPSLNIRTLHDQRREQGDHELYNGNHINVEPRNDDSDKDR